MERHPDTPRSTSGIREAGDRRVATVTRWVVAAAVVGAAAASSFAARGIPGRAATPASARGTG